MPQFLFTKILVAVGNNLQIKHALIALRILKLIEWLNQLDSLRKSIIIYNGAFLI